MFAARVDRAGDPLDDIVVVALALLYAGRQVLLAAWPGDPRLIERLLGKAR